MFIDSRTMKTLTAILFIAILVPLSAFAVNAGDVAPEFSLHDVNGSILTLNSFKGTVVFLLSGPPGARPAKRNCRT